MLFQLLAAGFAALSGLVLIFSRQIRAAVARARRYLRERTHREEPEEPAELADGG
jgi:hypothetical protein